MSDTQDTRPLRAGEPAPWFIAATSANPQFGFASIGGIVVALLFVGSLSSPDGRALLDAAIACNDIFDDEDATLLVVSTDPEDRSSGRLDDQIPGLRCIWDYDGAVSELFGVRYAEADTPRLFVMDEALRIVGIGGAAQAGEQLARLRTQLPTQRERWRAQTAPVLTVPSIFEPALCRALIEHYEKVGGSPSGFMRQAGEKTVGRHDPNFKRRRDVIIDNEDMQQAIRNRVRDRLGPMIERAFGWKPTRIERYIIACYSADEQGFFRQHRDNTSAATAHRKFAVSINLNGNFTGGDLRFPEFGSRTYRPPPGGATVFACGLLHEATPVTQGRRYAVLPFLYDDEAAVIRAATKSLIVDAPPPLPANS